MDIFLFILVCILEKIDEFLDPCFSNSFYVVKIHGNCF